MKSLVRVKRPVKSWIPQVKEKAAVKRCVCGMPANCILISESGTKRVEACGICADNAPISVMVRKLPKTERGL